MMNANEARAKTVENLKADEEKRMNDLRTWVEENCGPAVTKAIEARKFEVSVEVPRTHDAGDVASELRDKGFAVNICWGTPNNIVTINWRKQ